jgi:uncharacterized protein YcfJ
MRAKEFISEDRQKLDEIAPLAVGLWLATAGLTAAEMKSIYDDYKSGKISGKEALAAAGIQGGATAIGGLGGKILSKAPAVVGAVAKPIKDVTKKVLDKVKSKPTTGTVTPKVTSRPNLKSTKQRGASIKQDPKTPKSKAPAGATGAAIGTGLKKGKDFVKKNSKGALTAAGALAGTAIGPEINKADQYKDAFSDYFKAASKYQAPEPEKTGKLVYTSPTPGPTQKFDPGGLGLKGEKKPNTKGTK